MTNERAKAEINQLYMMLSEEKKKALDVLMAQADGDAISRQAVLDIAKSSKSNWIDNSVLFKRVNELPSVNPQEKTGHWIAGEIWEDTDGGWGRWQKCSICRQSEHHKTNFCPNCGAKMNEPQERSE